ncbi:hypothetical protein EN925_08300 [Mesorhizobium sp. M7A.F.Ca.US.006.04.2.1]|uniref:hypothetical protein n=1 Tax=unclassified Mesorhizobium TaxID=325217 RepID=UPI000FCBE3BC|nr:MULTISPECIES: hypothetical protein [unclassified Mesorhizobium]RUY18221.1 hypothetical protein EN991_04870 [Mesorhizobium sp. M7A.F.Ca.US.005.03.2.1]RVA93478.1 hypothetical protein EN925_08300 [Mesorhizobium sp. M7A.F.Ca.US.006.04.2.1]
MALPAIGGQNILLLKGTALASTITVFDLMGAANLVRAQTVRVNEPLFAAALGYFLLAVGSRLASGFQETARSAILIGTEQCRLR